MKNEKRDNTIKSIRQRILDEHRKYAHQESIDWSMMAACKIYSAFIEHGIRKKDIEEMNLSTLKIPIKYMLFSYDPVNLKNKTMVNIAEIENFIKDQKIIALIRDKARNFKESEYPKILAKLSTPQVSSKDSKESGKSEPIPHQLTAINSIKVPFEKAWLTNEMDVDSYIKSMREAMIKEIHKGRKIQI